jgi:small-conductance mechanosensitive channel
MPSPSPAPLDLPFLEPIHDPLLAALVRALLILAASYGAAFVLSGTVVRLLMARARRTAADGDDALVRSIGRPLALALFMVGARFVLAVVPIPEAFELRLAQLVFAVCVGAACLALVRAWRLLLFWWAREPGDGAPKPWSADFGPLLGKLGALLIGLIGFTTVLENVGVDVKTLVVSLGVGSLAVGLAAQDTLANMFAGFTLLLDRPFRVGERIQLASGEIGDVETIGLRATRIRTPDETMLVLPNTILTKEKVVNLSRPTRSLTTRVAVSAAYGSELAEVRRILLEAARRSALVEPTREPVVLLNRFGDFAVEYLLVFWVRDYVDQGLARSEIQEEIYRRFQETGIEVPFPVRRIIQEAASPAGRGGGEARLD